MTPYTKAYVIGALCAALITAVCLNVAPALAQSMGARVNIAQRLAMQGDGTALPACAMCHGANGEGNVAAGFPRLAGLSRHYLIEQLDAFADGSRQSPSMQAFASHLSHDERSQLATYFSSLPGPAYRDPPPLSSLRPSNRGEWLALRGDGAHDVPACAQCHGVDGAGVGDVFPPLAGQSAAYLRNQLHAWRHGLRNPGPLALMPAVAWRLSASDIDAVAAYYETYIEHGGDAPSTDRNHERTSR